MPGEVGVCSLKTGHIERPYVGKYLKDVSRAYQERTAFQAKGTASAKPLRLKCACSVPETRA